MQSDTASPKRGSPLPLSVACSRAKKSRRATQSRPTGSFFGDVSVDLLLDLGSLTDAVAQVVQLRTANLTDANDGNARNVRGMQGEGLFHTAAIRDAANRKRSRKCRRRDGR